MYVFMYVCMYVCIYLYVCMYVCMFVYALCVSRVSSLPIMAAKHEIYMINARVKSVLFNIY